MCADTTNTHKKQEKAMEEEARRQVCQLLARQDNVVVVSQQRGEADPTVEQKEQVLLQKLEANPGSFLQRWGSHLPQEALAHFEPLRGTDVVVTHYLDRLQATAKQQAATVRNRYAFRPIRGGCYRPLLFLSHLITLFCGCVCACPCVCACVRACVCMCVCMCAHTVFLGGCC